MTRWLVLVVANILIFPLYLYPQIEADQEKNQEKRPASLLRLKAELASHDRPYLHITPERVYLYLQGILLKQLPLAGMIASDSPHLRSGRVLDWTPEAIPPTVTADDLRYNQVQALHRRLRLEQVPSTFAVRLTDGTLLLVSPRPSITAALQALHLSAEPEKKLFLRMSAHHARQFHWHLQEGMGVVY